MTTQELTSTDKSLTFEQLPPLLPQQAKMLQFIIDGCNYTEAYRNAGYSSINHADKAAWYMISHNPLKAHLEYYRAKIASMLTPEYVLGKLNQIVDSSISSDNPMEVDKEVAIKALQEVNKMRGYYTPTQVQVNSVHQSTEDVRNALKEYKSEY